ncbi:sulfite exporter TauE/SafE family protein [Pontibacter brevis]
MFVTGIHQLLLNAVPQAVSEHISSEIFLYMLAGFVAQMIDGALGMAYGVSSTTFLMAMGVPAAAASASVHTSEIFTSGVSGLMHLKFGNVNRKLFQTLLLPGVIGAVLGAYILSSLEQYDYIIKPIVSAYTLVLGIIIIRKAYELRKAGVDVKNVAPLAVFGGFMDSVGGGGWGPIVSSTLMARGNSPRFTIGSVNLAEFFVALASSLTFFTMIGLVHWQVIVGLILGGVFAAPVAASLTRRLPVKTIMLTVGIVVVLISLKTIITAVLKLM